MNGSDPARRPSPESLLPLKPAVFHILVALADHEQHGYAILQDVEERSEGRVVLRTGPLYRHLRQLLDEGLVEEVASPHPEDDDARRRYYALSSFGRRIVAAESRRLVRLVDAVRALDLLREGGGA